MNYPKPPMMSWDMNLKQYGSDSFIATCVESKDEELHLFGSLLTEMKKLDDADLNKIKHLQAELIELGHNLEDGLRVGVSDLGTDARRLLSANGVAY